MAKRSGMYKFEKRRKELKKKKKQEEKRNKKLNKDDEQTDPDHDPTIMTPEEMAELQKRVAADPHLGINIRTDRLRDK